MSLFIFEDAVKEMAHLKGCPASKQGRESQAKAFSAAVRAMGEYSESMVEAAGKHFARHADSFPKTGEFAAKVHQVQTSGTVLNPVWIVEEHQPCAATRNYAGQRNLDTYETWADADKAAQEMWERDFPEQAKLVAESLAKHRARRRRVA